MISFQRMLRHAQQYPLVKLKEFSKGYKKVLEGEFSYKDYLSYMEECHNNNKVVSPKHYLERR